MESLHDFLVIITLKEKKADGVKFHVLLFEFSNDLLGNQSCHCTISGSIMRCDFDALLVKVFDRSVVACLYIEFSSIGAAVAAFVVAYNRLPSLLATVNFSG